MNLCQPVTSRQSIILAHLCQADSGPRAHYKQDKKGIKTKSDVIEPPKGHVSLCIFPWRIVCQKKAGSLPSCPVQIGDTVVACLGLFGTSAGRQAMMSFTPAKTNLCLPRSSNKNRYKKAGLQGGTSCFSLSGLRSDEWGKEAACCETAYSVMRCGLCGLHGGSSVNEWMWQWQGRIGKGRGGCLWFWKNLGCPAFATSC